MKNISLAAIAILAFVPLVVQAGHHHHSCCSACGCAQVRKVCRLVPDVKKVSTPVYTVECEDYCPPGPSSRCGVKCVPDCNAFLGYRKEYIWSPACSCPVVKKKLVKKTETVEKPSYKCVVERICCGCNCAMLDVEATAHAQQYVDALPEDELQKLADLVVAPEAPAAAADGVQQASGQIEAIEEVGALQQPTTIRIGGGVR